MDEGGGGGDMGGWGGGQVRAQVWGLRIYGSSHHHASLAAQQAVVRLQGNADNACNALSS